MAASETNEVVLTVSAVTQAVSDLIDNTWGTFWLAGEVGTLLIHHSGHVYLTIKDSTSQIKAVFFGGAARARELELAIGMQIECHGKLRGYSPRGEYQFAIREIRLKGAGDLQQQFELLKKKSAAEGLFAAERKRALTALPERVGIITAPDGAALRDFLKIAGTKFPSLPIRIYPAKVQGEGAAQSVIRGLDFFNRTHCVEVIVIARGGGSMEDLWAFNDEALARKIAASTLPVISAIGHEIDFTIADFVADVRAATPSEAAELVIGGRESLETKVEHAWKDACTALTRRWETALIRLERCERNRILADPLSWAETMEQRLDHMELYRNSALDSRAAVAANRLQNATIRLNLPISQHCNRLEQLLRDQEVRITGHWTTTFMAIREQLENCAHKLQALDPNSVLVRGYALIRNRNGSVRTSAQGLQGGERLTISFHDGDVAVKTMTQVEAMQGDLFEI